MKVLGNTDVDEKAAVIALWRRFVASCAASPKSCDSPDDEDVIVDVEVADEDIIGIGGRQQIDASQFSDALQLGIIGFHPTGEPVQGQNTNLVDAGGRQTMSKRASRKLDAEWYLARARSSTHAEINPAAR